MAPKRITRPVPSATSMPVADRSLVRAVPLNGARCRRRAGDVPDLWATCPKDYPRGRSSLLDLNAGHVAGRRRRRGGAWLLEAGADIRWVQRQLGHATIAQTSDTYGHLESERHEERVNLDEVLTPKRVPAWRRPPRPPIGAGARAPPPAAHSPPTPGREWIRTDLSGRALRRLSAPSSTRYAFWRATLAPPCAKMGRMPEAPANPEEFSLS